MKKQIVSILILCLAVFVIAAKAQNPDAAKTVSTKASYNELLEKVKKGDYTVDFKVMRFAFADTDGSYSDSELIKKMNTALAGKDYKQALKAAEEQLTQSYVNIKAHIVAYNACKQLGRAEQADTHNKMAVGLARSIIGDLDGGTTKTAWAVINVGEEYSVLSVLGYQVTSQALVVEEGHQYDLMSVVNIKTQEATKFYFNVDKVFEGYNKGLKK